MNRVQFLPVKKVVDPASAKKETKWIKNEKEMQPVRVRYGMIRYGLLEMFKIMVRMKKTSRAISLKRKCMPSKVGNCLTFSIVIQS